MRNIRQNLFFAFVYNALGVPIAAGVLYPVFGILLSPIIAAAAMALSSVSVIANAARLRTVELRLMQHVETAAKAVEPLLLLGRQSVGKSWSADCFHGGESFRHAGQGVSASSSSRPTGVSAEIAWSTTALRMPSAL